MRTTFVAIAILSLTAGTAYAQGGDRCRHEDERNQALDVAGANRLDLESGAGTLKVVGKSGLSRVVIRGKACASSADMLADIKLEASRSGGTIVVKANVDNDFNRSGWRNNQYARLDIVVEVPAGMAARIDDGSGSIDLENLGAVDIEDGSGEIVASNLAGVAVEDGSGEIMLSDIRGAVDIRDGSGRIELRDIDGAIVIRDSSGEIEIRGTRGNVRISDSSGSIDVADIGGDFVVTEDGSGGIDHSNVRGRVDIPRKRR